MRFLDRYADRHFKQEEEKTFFVLSGETYELTSEEQRRALHRLMRLDLRVAGFVVVSMVGVGVLVFLVDEGLWMAIFLALLLIFGLIMRVLDKKRKKVLEGSPVTKEGGEEGKKYSGRFMANFVAFYFVLCFWVFVALTAIIRWELIFGAALSLIGVVGAVVYKNLKYGKDGGNGNGEEPRHE